MHNNTIEKQHFLNENGFTLIELFTIIIIIGILAATVSVRYIQLTDSVNAAACKANQAGLEAAGTMYWAEHIEYAASIDQLAFYMPENMIPECPEDGTYTLNPNGTISCSIHARH